MPRRMTPPGGARCAMASPSSSSHDMRTLSPSQSLYRSCTAVLRRSSLANALQSAASTRPYPPTGTPSMSSGTGTEMRRMTVSWSIATLSATTSRDTSSRTTRATTTTSPSSLISSSSSSATAAASTCAAAGETTVTATSGSVKSGVKEPSASTRASETSSTCTPASAIGTVSPMVSGWREETCLRTTAARASPPGVSARTSSAMSQGASSQVRANARITRSEPSVTGCGTTSGKRPPWMSMPHSTIASDACSAIRGIGGLVTPTLRGAMEKSVCHLPSGPCSSTSISTVWSPASPIGTSSASVSSSR
mmetsp:Transcript_2593/g.6197  ORF Transcript_2593/g.6197 Transcript_2593/m.6197 type:complete len:308 (+) Transcript_2593:146-1069(+)